MYFTKLPIDIFNCYKGIDEILPVLYVFFNQTTQQNSLTHNEKTPQNEKIKKLTQEHFFCIPSPAFLEEQGGAISSIDLIIYAHLCKDAYLTGNGKVKININNIYKDTAIRKTLIRNSINNLNQADLITKDSLDGYYIIDDLFYYFTDNDFRKVINNIDHLLLSKEWS
ncbi:hypothetical protein [Bacillus multifaciens]|uniref:hypothetical protein n=1 Tax=Bacillus multifaciens TaxID=3068506 RepID=UPI0027417178|nr:hypothetical protein [Bacillus sp. WLY-B-L8]MDP7981244.1 hypothetical protein [Bacillus sp. WLY-B-L8]